MISLARTPMLDIGYEAHGPAGGDAVVLLHGFPYDPRCYDGMAPRLAALGYRVIVPYLRGCGPTRFLSAATLRSGQQAALGCDLRDLLDALEIRRAALVGYDWGGRAACIVAALWPERVRCLVTGGGYNIQDIAAASSPQPAWLEHRLWYQYYFNTERGRAGLAADRGAFCRLLWRLWSPGWRFDDAVYAASSVSFDNPDFIDVVIHSYRHRFGYVAGDPGLQSVEDLLAGAPAISIPTISLHGGNDGVAGPAKDEAPHFTGFFERRELPGIGHDIPQEAPQATLIALVDLLARASSLSGLHCVNGIRDWCAADHAACSRCIRRQL